MKLTKILVAMGLMILTANGSEICNSIPINGKNFEICCSSEHEFYNDKNNELEIKKTINEVSLKAIEQEVIGTLEFVKYVENKLSERLSSFYEYRDVKVIVASTKWN